MQDMKATGIVRRIDDLGRVVIPKEIRRTMHLFEGDPLEIYTAEHGLLILKKYSAVMSLGDISSDLVEVLSKNAGCPVLLTDTDRIVASCGSKIGNLSRLSLSVDMLAIIRAKKQYVQEKDKLMSAVEDTGLPVFAVIPIATTADTFGAVILVKSETAQALGDREVALAQMTADILSDQLKEG